MKKLRYLFEEVETCNMCGCSISQSRVIGQRMNKSQGLKPKSNSGITTTVMKCNNCHLIYANPLPIPADIQDHYGVPPEDYWQEGYFTADTNYFSEEISILNKLLAPEAGKKCLDIGAGLGKCMIALENAGFESYGFEPSIPFRERAISKMGINAERLKLGMIEEVEYPREFFDFVTFGAVLEHLYDPSACIEKALKWLKPSGILHIEVPSSDYFIPKILNLYYRLIGTNYVNNISPMHEPFHLYEFGLKSFEEHSKRLYYEIAFHKYYVCGIYHIPKMFHPVLSRYMDKTDKGMQLSVWLRKLH
jgi:2-polyprenyl-3-methyl-5-hydroxy-6-metoxy-1,4-benzoquinol methylase